MVPLETFRREGICLECGTLISSPGQGSAVGLGARHTSVTPANEVIEWVREWLGLVEKDKEAAK
jgi:hypothetical protein